MSERGEVPDLPVPSEPDESSKPGEYNEPDLDVPYDEWPDGTFVAGGSRSKAAVRLRAEQLLTRRDSVEDDAWRQLEGVGPVLVRMLDDTAIVGNPAILARLIATLAMLGERSAVPRLSEIATTRRWSFAIRAQAVNALGRIGDTAALDALLAASTDSDPALRRQVAFALGRIETGEATALLRLLADDDSPVVAEVALGTLTGEPTTVVSGSGEPKGDRDRAPRTKTARR